MKWFRRLLYLLLALLMLAVISAGTAPLRFVLDHLGPPPFADLDNVRGGVLDGRVTAVFKLPGSAPPWARSLAHADLAWRWCPGWEGGLAVLCIQVDTPLAKVQGMVSWSPLHLRALTLHRVAMEARLEDYPMPLGAVTMPISTDLRATLEKALLAADHPFPRDALGEIVVKDLAAGPVTAGNYRLQFASGEKDGLDLNLRGGGEMFKASGKGRLTPAGVWNYDITVKSDTAVVRDYLERVGKKTDRGDYHLSGNGKLFDAAG